MSQKGPSPGENRINGIIFPSFITQKRVDELKDWPLLPDDVYVVSYPRSGTTWTQQIVKLIRSNGVENGVTMEAAIPWLSLSGPEVCKEIPSPRSFKSHATYDMMPGGDPAKSPSEYIYVARNPKDTLVSFYLHCRAYKGMVFCDRPWDWFFEQTLTGEIPFGSWFDHVLGWWKHKESDNILFLKYEDMKKDLPKAVESIASFIGYKLEPQVVDSIAQQCAFQSMKENPAANTPPAPQLRKEGSEPFIRKGIVGDWKNYFTEDQNQRFDEQYTEKMSGTGLEFIFEQK